jgi:hypothetical protein
VKTPHEISVLLRDGLIVIVNEQAVVLLVGILGFRQILLEPGHYLLKRLLIYCSGCSGWIEVKLVYALSKQPGKSPAGDAIGDVRYELPAFISREVNVGVCVGEILFLLLVGLVVLALQQLQELPMTFVLDSNPALFPTQSRKVGDPLLLDIGTQNPRRMKFRARESIAAEYCGYLTVSIMPMPDRHRQTRENKMRCIPRDLRGS